MKSTLWLLPAVLLTTPGLGAAESAGAGNVGPGGSVPWDEIGVTEHLGEPVSLDNVFVGEDGREQPLATFTGGKPTVLSLVYFDCTTLCPEVLKGLSRAIKAMSLQPGKDFELVTVSFDPGDGMTGAAAAEKKEYGSRAGGWRFLTGRDASVARLTKEVGFRYVSDAAKSQFAHPAVVVILSPAGVVSRYFYGLDVAPRDLELALVEASEGKIGTTVDRVLLYCYHYDPTTGKYGLVITRVIRLAGVATILAIAGLIAVLSRLGGR
jgi:protein SCO1/2